MIKGTLRWSARDTDSLGGPLVDDSVEVRVRDDEAHVSILVRPSMFTDVSGGAKIVFDTAVDKLKRFKKRWENEQ